MFIAIQTGLYAEAKQETQEVRMAARGQHCLKSGSSNQKMVQRSSEEAELMTALKAQACCHRCPGPESLATQQPRGVGG